MSDIENNRPLQIELIDNLTTLANTINKINKDQGMQLLVNGNNEQLIKLLNSKKEIDLVLKQLSQMLPTYCFLAGLKFSGNENEKT